MKINTNLKIFTKQHIKKNNQIIYNVESIKNNNIIENLIDNFLIDKNSFVFESVEKAKFRGRYTIFGKNPDKIWELNKNKVYLIKKGKKKIVPMVIDLINPNANIGFNNKEKFSFLSRIENKIDFVLSLAVVHHFVFQNNISLTQTLKMIIKLGKRGIIEYIPKNDVMLKKMIDRKTIYHHDYNLKNFELILSKSTKYQKKEIIKENGRILYYYEK